MQNPNGQQQGVPTGKPASTKMPERQRGGRATNEGLSIPTAKMPENTKGMPVVDGARRQAVGSRMPRRIG